MQIRFAAVEDAETLGVLNAQLIRDEGHRNAMTIPELTQRMADWLRGEYEGALVEEGGTIFGYALYRREADYVYLRQIFVRVENRRRGIGRSLFQWLLQNSWQAAPRIRIDVLVGNNAGRRFWESIGFREYCLTMELDTRPSPDSDQPTG
ncbi:MAG TPA: GNAT family N-acetyltransferase [Planctomycetaceae bacterium]|jgi:GNAT superfamily N-acetyltransferase|nr:GNAT family N-acetyltransferase [Planctomycetaceae bacterium]